MKLSEMRLDEARAVEGYGPGFFRVAGAVHEGPMLLGPAGPAPWQGWADEAPLLALAGQVDLVLLGTGAEMAPPPAALIERLHEAGLATEFMATPAACRTFNVLLAERRRVALAALPV